ncbi:putative translocation protein SEC62 [Scophthalmus maximus]|uniref:Translocation protein SEC62 n=1 Tax=Scophthalmus maximus TaxID=52904 RepID=A0A2U9BID8_SCOMX|nr:putative translocation protein SEC62 [Scophthalmus maximus]
MENPELSLKFRPVLILKPSSQEVSEPTKEEKAVAKYLRFNCPTKSTNMMGHRVDYFIASKAVDCLMDSKWAKAKKGEEALFTTRESVLDYCNRLLKKQFFHRALKVMKKKPEKDTKKEKEKEKEKEKTKSDSSKEEEKKGKKEKEKKKETEVAETKKDKSDDSPGSPKKKKEVKKKFKLEPHEDQLFLDGNEVYVWIYDPVHFKTFAMGLILVIAVIAATLFPLWPAEMRVGVYYLSVAAGCFVASILLLAVARCILFLLIWLVTGGRHHFWFLPNLTADVGFIDSFRPLYTHEYKGPRSGNKKGSDKTDEKDADDASGKAQKSDSDEKSDSEKKDCDEEEEEEEEEESKEVGGEESKEETAAERHSDTDSDRREDEGSQHSNGNDFEMITREELEQHTEEEEEDQEGEEGEEEEEEDGEDTTTQQRKEDGGSETKPQTAET